MKISRTLVSAELARRSLANFAEAVSPDLILSPFHRTYYAVLDLFARGHIKKLIVSIPPQHGKSTGSSQLLPAYMLGLDPGAKIALASYNVSLAARFNRQVQRIVDSPGYKSIFPNTRLRGRTAKDAHYVRNNDEFDIVGTGGRLLAVGREGSLTGNAVDVFILDDLYKDAMEANSPLIRDNTWAWYNSVVKTRLHNDSRELIVFTRWHEDDLIGRIALHEPVLELTDLEQLENVAPDCWLSLNFEAIKASSPTPVDPRIAGEPLWDNRHSLGLLEKKRQLDPFVFETMYQGHPATKEGVLYGEFSTYKSLPEDIIKKGNYTDTADMGEDFLCSVCYSVGRDRLIYVTDVIYSQEGMEKTEAEVGEMLARNFTGIARIESNNGGRGFARSVGRMVPDVRIEWFHQSKNKEARILSNSASVPRFIVMPEGWNLRWRKFYSDIVTYRRLYRANRWHDAADVLTGIIETEADNYIQKKIRAYGFKT